MKKLILLPFLFASFLCNAQNPNIKRTWHWYFGNGAGIDFSSGIAVADTNGQLYASEGGSSISDTSGNLLFYTDGRTVWNHLHQVMPNGTGLMGGALGSSTQAALIVPQPLSSNLLYVFTTDESQNLGANGMRYSIVDMNLDGGNGDVTSQKNVLLFSPCTEKLAAINYCNDTSVWIMGHEANNNNYRAYLLTPNGLNASAVISSTGTPMLNGDWYGQMKFSPNGKMLATGMGDFLNRCEIYQFDNYTGMLSNRIIVFDTITSTNASGMNVGVSFSPDNNKLYIGQIFTQQLLQFDVSVFDSINITSSRVVIYNATGTNQVGFRILQNGSDGKIYINHANVTFDSSLSVINSPNNLGGLCNFSFASFYLKGRVASGGLNELNESYFNQSISNGCLTGISEFKNNAIKIFPNSARDWIILEGRGIKSVEITNALGSTIGSYPTTASSLRNMLNISSLSCGIYFFRINMIDERFSFQKIIVQH